MTIIGTTSWGITLAIMLAHKGLNVSLWARTKEEADRIVTKGPDPRRLPGVTLPPTINITADTEAALLKARAVLLVVPSTSMRQNVRHIAPHLRPSMLIISAAKGLEAGSCKRMSEVIAGEVGPSLEANIAVLSGPNLYREILAGLPAASIIASNDERRAHQAQRIIESPNFSVYITTDVVGVELGGALKNVIAIGAGIVDGLGYGDNAKAAFIARGLTEITAFAVALGGSPITLAGLAGLGDLIATCASPLSRNHYIGMELAKGRSLADITTSMTSVAEGINTTQAVWETANRLGIEMPTTERLYQVLFNGASARKMVDEVLNTRGRHELAGRRWKLLPFLKHRHRSEG